jgi:hypothetical protein
MINQRIGNTLAVISMIWVCLLLLRFATADDITVYTEPEVVWQWTPAANAESYEVWVMEEGLDQAELYEGNIPPDTIMVDSDGDGTEDLEVVRFTVIMTHNTTYQIYVVAVRGTERSQSRISTSVKIDLSPGQPQPQQ